MRHRGLLTMDCLIGLTLLVTIAVVLAVSAAQERRGVQAAVESRIALQQAEAALVSLQHGQAFTPAAEVQIRLTPKPADAAPAGTVWVESQATYRGHSQTLLGLVSRLRMNGVASAAGGRP